MLHKAIASGKEWRKPWRGSKAFDYTCHNHGACSYCRSNRLFKHLRGEIYSKKDLKHLDNVLENE